MKNLTRIKSIEKELAKLVRQHDKIDNPICYTGNCIVCQKMNELQNELKKLRKESHG